MKSVVGFFSTWVIVLASFSVSADQVSDLLQNKHRPDVDQVAKIPEKVMVQNYGQVAIDDNLAITFELYEEVEREISKNYSGLDIFVFARDSEPLFDALWTMGKKRERDHLHLIQMSRASIDSPSKNIQRYLDDVGMDIEKVLAGKRKIVWLDTGSRGSIYVALLNHIIDGIDENDPKRIQKITNVIENVEPLLIVAWEEPTRKKILKALKNTSMTNDEIKTLIDSEYYFLEIPASKTTRKRFGLVGDDWTQNRRIADLIEYTAKWQGRAESVGRKGHIDYSTDHDQYIDKKSYLLRQWKISQYFKGKVSGPRCALQF